MDKLDIALWLFDYDTGDIAYTFPTRDIMYRALSMMVMSIATEYMGRVWDEAHIPGSSKW